MLTSSPGANAAAGSLTSTDDKEQNQDPPMTIMFDLNTNASSTERPLWESSPLDIVVTIGPPDRASVQTEEATIQPHIYIHPPARDVADDEDITWSDAEWQ